MTFQNTLNNLLNSGHHFSKDNNLMKYRFIFLNLILLSISLYMFVRYITSLFSIIPLSEMHEKIIPPYILINVIALYLLRKNKNTYLYVTNFIIICTFIVIYLIMFQTQENELRLVWFFTPLFLGFILIGKKYGLYSLLFIYVSTFLFEKYIGFGYSKLALSTFYSSITLFSLFTYAFLYKIDKDEKEFKVLNNELQDKVLYEVEQRQEQEKMLLRQCRMANMGEMIDAIAHQWRQPLMSINAVLMNLGVLAEDKKEHQELKEGIDEIASLTSHMSQTINDFRTLYQIEKQKSFFSIDTLLKDINELMKNNLQDIHLEVHGDDNVEIYSYKSELTQVLITLLSNAIEVLHSRNIVDKKIYIAYYQRGKYLFIEVEDNAGGVVESNLSKVFDPYFTTKKQSGGTGLGLYITQIIIEHNMYGTISVRNTKEGAKFLIKLPK